MNSLQDQIVIWISVVLINLLSVVWTVNRTFLIMKSNDDDNVSMKNVIIKSLLLSKSSKYNEKNLSYKTTNNNISLIKILFDLKPVQKMIVPKEVHKAIMADLIKIV